MDTITDANSENNFHKPAKEPGTLVSPEDRFDGEVVRFVSVEADANSEIDGAEFAKSGEPGSEDDGSMGAEDDGCMEGVGAI